MTWHEAGPAERPKLREWLLNHQRGPVFALSNMLADGLMGDDTDGRHAMRFWIADGWTGLVGIERGGMILPQTHDLRDLDGLQTAMAGISAHGLIGDFDQTGLTLKALGLDDRPIRTEMVQISYGLTLDKLRMPDCEGLRLLPFHERDQALLTGWFTEYDSELGLNPPDHASRQAPDTVNAYRRADSHRVLWRGDQPVAMTGFNARLPGLVQVGGVYCPPDLRGQGFARAAVAMHLNEARIDGVTRAFLFAASDIAARAYLAIGFRPEGRIRLVLFESPETVG